MAKSRFEKYLVRKPIYERAFGIKNCQSPTMTYMSSAQVPESNCYIELGWIFGIPEPNPPVKQHMHNNDEIILYIGSDPQNPEDLGSEIELFLGNQPLTFSTSVSVFVPKRLIHGPVTWKTYRKPHIKMTLMLGTGTIKNNRSSSNIPEVKVLPHEKNDTNYEKYLIRKPIYERGRGVKNRQCPTMTFMSSAQVPESNCYIEFGWIFGIPEPNPAVLRHFHNTDEIILHFGGDPQNPEDLGSEIEIMVEDEQLVFNTNTALFAPKGLTHCPVTWKKFKKPHIEMAITLGSGIR